MDPIENYIGWLKRRVTLNDTEIWYVKFIMDQYAKDYHDSEVKKLNLPDVSKCAKCNDEYQRGIEDGKIIAEHGTVNWID